MVQLLFKYPIPVFTKGRFVLLAPWSGWVLLVFILALATILAILIRRNLPRAAPKLQTWRAAALWALQSALIALLLLLLWRPAVSIAELKSQQNLIAVLIDDSRSMATPDAGPHASATREAEALRTLQSGILAGLQKKFQVRLYRVDANLTRLDHPADAHPEAPATHLGESLRRLTAETADLPVGAIVLLSDGAENSGGIDLDTLAALRNRRLPVHTIGFGREHPTHDLELDDVTIAPRALAGSRLSATVTFHQHGFAGAHTTLSLRDGAKTLAQRDLTLAPDAATQTETLFFDAGPAGVKSLATSLAPLPNEENVANNQLTRLVDISGEKRRILYVEGEPRWEYKFLRRAADDDTALQLVSMLRTTENKIYRQGIADPRELAEGFPTRPEDLFAYQGILVGSVEAGFFTPTQQQLLREFVDRRGGGLLFLGGRFALAEGGWGASSDADLLPTFLPNAHGTFHRDPATTQLTAAGQSSTVTRLVDDPARNADRWRTLPYLADFQDAGTPKPGATVLADLRTAGRTFPLLTTQTFGHGRTALLATSGTWRWQMASPLGDPSHDLFWKQLLRWLSATSPGPVTASTPTPTLMDEGHVQLTALVRDKQFHAAPDAHVTAHILGPESTSAQVDLAPVPNTPGAFAADWTAEKPGAYLAEVSADRQKEELGRDIVAFERTEGVAENFHTGQNKDLLQKLSAETGGRFWTPADVSRLPTEISYSEAGISVRDTKELWNMPIVFLTLLALLAARWLLRRKWGVV